MLTSDSGRSSAGGLNGTAGAGGLTPVRDGLGTSLSSRDQAILSAVGSLRLATGGQLQRLFFAESSSTDVQADADEAGTGSSSPRVGRRALQRLTDRGLLMRLQRRVGGVRAGSSSYVYALTPRGGRAIGLSVGRGRVREPSLTFAMHTLAVAETCVQLHEARRAGQLASLQIEVEPSCWRDLGGMDATTLKPDLFVLAAAGHGAGDGRDDDEHLAFVEVDLGSEHGPAIRRKAAVYERYFRSGREQARLGAFPRVLWLAPDEARRRRLQTVLTSDRGLTVALHRVGLLSNVLGGLLGDEAPGGEIPEERSQTTN